VEKWLARYGVRVGSSCFLGWRHIPTRPDYRLKPGQETFGSEGIRTLPRRCDRLRNWFAFGGSPPRLSHDKAKRLVWLWKQGVPQCMLICARQLLFGQEKSTRIACESLTPSRWSFGDSAKPLRLKTRVDGRTVSLEIETFRRKPMRLSAYRWKMARAWILIAALIDRHRRGFVIYYRSRRLLPHLGGRD